MYPLIILTGPIGAKIIHWFLQLIEKSTIEKQEEALIEAEERIRIAELQKQTMQAEKQAMRIRNSIIDEEFEELDEELDEELKRSKL